MKRALNTCADAGQPGLLRDWQARRAVEMRQLFTARSPHRSPPVVPIVKHVIVPTISAPMERETKFNAIRSSSTKAGKFAQLLQRPDE